MSRRGEWIQPPKWPHLLHTKEIPDAPYVYRAFCPIAYCGFDTDVHGVPEAAERELAAHLQTHAKERVRVIAQDMKGEAR